MFGWDLAGTVVNEAAKQVGLAIDPDPFLSTDPNFVQLCSLLTSLGQEIWREKEWTHLQTVYTFTTVQNQYQYPLPTDFGHMINQTGWNRTNRLPLGGPLSPQEWEYLKARLVGVVFTVLFRPMQQQMWLYPDTNTPGGYTIAFEYISRNWVNLQAGALSEAPTGSNDTLRFDRLLLIYGLKLKWLAAKGFATGDARDEHSPAGAYAKALQQSKASDTAAQVLRLNRRRFDDPVLGERNVPLTGFGS